MDKFSNWRGTEKRRYREGSWYYEAVIREKINNCSIRYIDLANIVEKYGYSIDIHKK